MNESRNTTKPRILYIDNLRIILTFLVVLHHWAIANGGPGDWYYNENNLSEIGQLLLSIFVATNQAFFMGFFFFISAYFIPRSLEKKGSKLYVSERIKRLGIPLVFYFLVISPIIIFLVEKYSKGYPHGFIQFLSDGEGIYSPGPLWFVALLLIFSLLYLLFSMIMKSNARMMMNDVFKPGNVALLFVLLVTVTFVMRIFFPVGDWIPIIGIQPAHLTQYVFCFVLGIIVVNNNSLEQINYISSRRWFFLGQFLIFIVFPAMFLFAGGAENVDLFMGGFTYQSFLYTLWEQLVAVSLIIGLLGIFKKYFNHQTTFLKDISENSYAIYILHGVALVTISLLVQSWKIDSMYKFLLLAVPGLVFSYLLAKFARKLPYVGKII